MGPSRSCSLQPQLDGIRKRFSLHPDESGWLFLGGSVATGARLRFTSRKNREEVAISYFIRIHLPCLKTRASSCSRLLKVLSIHGKQVPYEPAANFESSPIGIAFND